MAIREIVLYPDEVLLKKCAPVDQVDDEIRQLVDDMLETMYDAQGIGLAAPQVGISKRIAVIDIGTREEGEEPTFPSDPLVLINPKITSRQGTIVWDEGCLSIPGIYEKVTRAERIVVTALDRDGNPYELEAEELLAVAIQHELDHLDGVLIFDHLSLLKRRMALKKYKKLLARQEEEDSEAEDDSNQAHP